MACLLRLKEEGKIRAIGVSNVEVAQIKQYEAIEAIEWVRPAAVDRKEGGKVIGIFP